MASTWGGTAIPDPENYSVSEEFVGAQYVAASGALLTDAVASRRRIEISWGVITTAEKDTLLGKATTQATSALVMPGLSSTNVEPVRNSFQASPVGVTPVWDVSCTVRTTA